MNFRTHRIAVAALVVAAGIGLTGRIRAQAPDSSFSSDSSSSSSDRDGSKIEVLRHLRIDGKNFQYSSSNSLLKAAEAVRNAKGDEEEAAARKKLAEAVEKCFDEDLAQRKKDLAQLEERLAKLHVQLERRKAKKQDIVDLQIKVLLNEADGLGFTSGSTRVNDAMGLISNPFALPPTVTITPPVPAKPPIPKAPAKVKPPKVTKPETSEEST